MKSITLKNIPQAVHVALKNRAKLNRRSLNKEALACLETAVLPTRVNTDDMLAGIRQHRASLPGSLTDRLIIEAKTKGRP